MKNAIKITIFIIILGLAGFDVLLYMVAEKEKTALDAIKTQQQMDSNQFKYQQQQIQGLSHELEGAQQQLKDQNDELDQTKQSLIQEAQKRQEVASDNKAIQTSLVDIKAETDAIKEDMKGWQKDYVSVLAHLEKKMDDSQREIKNMEDNLVSLDIPGLKDSISTLKADVEKMENTPNTAPAPLSDNQQVDHPQASTQ